MNPLPERCAFGRVALLGACAAFATACGEDAAAGADPTRPPVDSDDAGDATNEVAPQTSDDDSGANDDPFTWAGPAPTNTNACVADLAGVQVCRQLDAAGLPADFAACCAAVAPLARDRCECNAALDLLLGEEGRAVYEIEPLCRNLQPASWEGIAPRAERTCAFLDRHDYGCEARDVDVDAARLRTIFGLLDLFREADAEACLDTPAFVAQLERIFGPAASVVVPYGIGRYTGAHDIGEYLGIAFTGLSHGYWRFRSILDGSAPSRLEVSADGARWIQGATTEGAFLHGRFAYDDFYLEQQSTFAGCDTLLSEYRQLPGEAMRDLVAMFTQTADLSRRWGLEDICRYHTRYCAPDPATRQYDSEAECLAYLGSLPIYTEACGPQRPLSGHSITCKFKHHFMIPTNPGLHCPHIGKLGVADIHDHLKCDDAVECTDPSEGVDWPPLTAIGGDTPAEVVELFDESNAGWEDEPFGCAVANEASGDGMH